VSRTLTASMPKSGSRRTDQPDRSVTTRYCALLDQMHHQDQRVRLAVLRLRQARHPSKQRLTKALEEAARCDSLNAKAFRAALDKWDWPMQSIHGATSCNAAFRIASHMMDQHLLARSVDLVKERLDEGEADPYHYAFLFDELSIRRGRPQEFGTHFVWTSQTGWALWPTRNVAEVDKRRRRYGICTVALELRRQASAERQWSARR